MKIFIYKHSKFFITHHNYFEECTDIEAIFHYNFINNYIKVDNILNADFAYIPFFMGSMYYSTSNTQTIDLWNDLYSKIIEPIEIRSKIPHIIIWGYVLYNVNLSFIPHDIYIISLESKNTFTYTHPEMYIHDRMVVVPYILKSQSHSSALSTTVVDNDRINTAYELSKINFENKENIVYIGRFDEDKRNVIIDHINKYITVKKYLPSEYDPFEIYKNSKFALVLRGDTITRKALFHCLASECIPIIYESTLIEYDNIYGGMFPSIRDIVVTIPDSDIVNLQYLNYITQHIKESLTKYNLDIIDKIKNTFERYNYFNLIDNISAPVYYSVKSILSSHIKNK
jgi:hypothetical protein